MFAFLAFRLQGDWTEINLWVCTLLQIAAALLLLLLNGAFSLIRNRTFLPAIFYLLLTGWNPIFHYDLVGSITTLAITLNYLLLFNTYQKRNSQFNAFNISLILLLGGFFHPTLLLFLPLFWIGFYWLWSLNLRTFLASLIAIVSIYWIGFAWSIYRQDWSIFLILLPNLEDVFFVNMLSLSYYEWIGFGIVSLILIFAGLNLFVLSSSEKLQTGVFFKFLYVSACIFLLLSLAQSEYRAYWGAIAYIPVSLIFAHYFTLTNQLIIKFLMLLFIFSFWWLGYLHNFPA
jgi:hypothetical protein